MRAQKLRRKNSFSLKSICVQFLQLSLSVAPLCAPGSGGKRLVTECSFHDIAYYNSLFSFDGIFIYFLLRFVAERLHSKFIIFRLFSFYSFFLVGEKRHQFLFPRLRAKQSFGVALLYCCFRLLCLQTSVPMIGVNKSEWKRGFYGAPQREWKNEKFEFISISFFLFAFFSLFAFFVMNGGNMLGRCFVAHFPFAALRHGWLGTVCRLAQRTMTRKAHKIPSNKR